MAGILNKARILFLSNIHQLLDKAIDMNSVAAVQQYVRDVEDALNELSESVAASKGSLNVSQRDQMRLQGEINQLNANIDAILTDGNPANDKFAVKWQTELTSKDQELDLLIQQVEVHQKEFDALSQTRTALENKKNAMVSQIDRLKSLQAMTEAKEQAASSIQQATELTNNLNGGPSVDNVTRRLEQRAATADAALDQAMGSINSTTGADEAAALAEIELHKRRVRLGLVSSTTTIPDQNSGKLATNG